MQKPEKGFFDWKEIGVFALDRDHIYIYDDDCPLSPEEREELLEKVRNFLGPVPAGTAIGVIDKNLSSK